MTHIEIDYAEAQGLRQIVFQLKKDALQSNDAAWLRCCEFYLKMLDDRINGAAMKHA